MNTCLSRIPAAVRWILLALESTLTALPFIVSWLVCAVILSIQAGYLMAKADSAQKETILQNLPWAKTRKTEP
jgi:hypothetical protein